MAKKPAAKPAKKLSLRPLLAVIGTVALAGFVYCAVVWLGKQASEAIVDRARYAVKFDDIQCPSPPGLDRAAFLAEVRYLANPPTEFSSADAAAVKKLAEVFAKHPWVAIATPSDAIPAWPSPVQLVFRTPALAVTVSSGLRVVDANGVLLPISANPASLPKLVTKQPGPNVEAGQVWQNKDVRKAIDLAKDHEAAKLEIATKEWRITLKNGKVLTVAR